MKIREGEKERAEGGPCREEGEGGGGPAEGRGLGQQLWSPCGSRQGPGRGPAMPRDVSKASSGPRTRC